MVAREEKSIRFPCVPLLMMCVLTLQPAVAAQSRDANSSLTPSQVEQVIHQVRTSSDEGVLTHSREIGGILLREGRFAEAVELFNALSEKRPSDPVVLYGDALSTFNVGRTAEAEPLARRAVDAAIGSANASGVIDRDRSQRAADALV